MDHNKKAEEVLEKSLTKMMDLPSYDIVAISKILLDNPEDLKAALIKISGAENLAPEIRAVANEALEECKKHEEMQ